jgi:hypothetical protein
LPSLATQEERSAEAASSGAVKAAVSDSWIHLFCFLVLISGGLTAHRFLFPRSAAAVEDAFSDEPPPAEGPEPKLPPILMPRPAGAGEAAAPVSAAAPPGAPAAAPQADGAGIAMVGKPKAAGRWVVDQAMGGGADRRTLSEALTGAQDGDIIVVRPGRYKESIVVTKSVTVLGGGASPDEVTLESDGPLTVAVAAGRPALKNLTIINDGQTQSTALSVIKADARLDRVILKSVGQGARVQRGSLTATGGSFAGRIALIAEENGRLSVEDASIAGVDVGALLKGDAITGTFSRCKFADSERAINIEGRSRLTLTDTDFSLTGVGGAVFVFAGAQATATRVAINLRGSSRVGFYVNNATLEGTGLKIQDSRRSGLIVTGESSVTLEDSQILKNGAAGVTAEKGARVTLRRVTLADNGDCGVQVNDGTAFVERSILVRNRCGVGFFGPGKLTANRSKFGDSALGAVAVSPGFESQVKIGGTGNDGFNPNKKDESAKPAGAAAGSPQQQGRRGFSNDIFQKFEERRRRGR